MGDVPDFVDEDDADVWEGGGTAYKIEKVVGNGAFGIVWKARAIDSGEVVAIKKVLLDRRYQNRELQMMKVMDHDCVVRLKHYYEKPGRKKDETFLQLVMEFLPDTLRSVTLRYQKKRRRFPVEEVQAYLYHMLKAMEYIHSRRICHRDIKPDNLLVDSNTLQLKLCDFGCSKVLVKGQPNISYICSRYYRAPELLFGATEYSCALDMWSIGTILAELLLGHLPFQGQDSTQQHLVEIMKLLGTPTNHDLQAMGASCTADDLPKLKPFPWDRVFPPGTPPDAIDLVSRLLMYNPETRLNAQQALAHPFLEGVSIGAARMPVDPGSPIKGARASEALAHTSAWVEDFSAKEQAFSSALVQGLEQSLLNALTQALGTGTPALNAAVAAARGELQRTAQSLEEHKQTTITSAHRLQQKIAAGGGAGVAGGGGGESMEVDSVRTERDQLQGQVAHLSKEVESAKAAAAKAEAALREAQTKMQQLETERAMGAVALTERGGGVTVTVGVQTDDVVADPKAGEAGHGRRAGGRSYMSGFFGNNGIVASPLLKRPSQVSSPMQQRTGGAAPEPDSRAVIMDGSQNLGEVRPQGAISPVSSHHSPRASGGKWGGSGGGVTRPTAGTMPPPPPSGVSAETSQPTGEDMMPGRRTMRRSFNEES
mmetsp:Transcript_27061/g.72930  ORF Transcript_27061/g.72930 Transcript_27061/m.72930 type:complete len:654 (+) Transcript_27061:87-2048(+)